MQGGDAETGACEESDRGRAVDARAARFVQIGDHNRQVNYSYHGTWTNGVAPAPLIGFTGEVESPYRGLDSFSEQDAPFFFGRDSAIDEVLQRLSHRVQQPGILLVSGVSGAGKSSLLRAGVLPAIRGQGLVKAPQAHRWPYLVLTAGRDPLGELAVGIAEVARLEAATTRSELRADPAGFAVMAAQAAQTVPAPPDGGSRGLLLVVDQFEQLFTQCPDESQRRAFVAALHAAATGGHAGTVTLVVLVVRADFEARCADYEQLIDAVQHHYMVTAMTERQLRMAITEPAKQAGSRIDDDLTAQLLRETRVRAVDVEPEAAAIPAAGVLPLLSYALDRTWRIRAGDTVTVADYERSGGLEDAVSESAERAYNSLTAPQQRAARRIFTRLVISSPGGTDTADRVHRDDLTWDGIASGDTDAVLEAFTSERLLTAGEQTVEISHEILLSTWPLLRDTWLAETRDIRAVSARIRNAAAEWEHSDRDPAHLYSGSVLHTAATTAEQIAADPARYPPLGATETQFLAAGIRARRRRTRRNRAAVGVLLFLVVALTAATLVAFRANQKSIEQRDKAIARELIADSERLATTDPFGSRISALAAWRIHPSPDARYAMLAALLNPAEGRFTLSEGVGAVAFGSDSETLTIGSYDGSVRLWDVQNNQLPSEPLAAPSEGARAVAFSPDGRTRAVGNYNGSVQFWNNRQLGEPLAGHTEAVQAMAFSPDGKTLATGSYDGSVQFWDAKNREPLGKPLPGHTGGVRAVAFSPNGETLATGGHDGSVRLWGVEGRRSLGELPAGRQGTVESVTFGPNGETVATGGYDGSVLLWDTKSRRLLGEPLTGHSGGAESVAFSPNGETLATGSGDRTVRLWNVENYRPVSEPLTPRSPRVDSAALSPGGKILATGSADQVQLWDVGGNRQRGKTLEGHTEAVQAVAFSLDGDILATGSYDDTVQLWDVETGRQRGIPLEGHTGAALSVAFSPDGETLATGSYDGSVRLWDVQNNQQPRELPTGHAEGGPRPPFPSTEGVPAVAFSPDGDTLATGSYDGSVRLWDVETEQQLGAPLEGHTGGALSVAFSPDGETLATGSYDGSVRLWDVKSNRQLGELPTGHIEGVTAVAFSPDGDTLATGSHDDTVRLWDVETNRALGEPLTGHTEGARSVMFDQHGETLALAVATGDAEVRLWDVGSTVDPAESLCTSIPDSRTRELWDDYVPPDSGTEYRELCP